MKVRIVLLGIALVFLLLNGAVPAQSGKIETSSVYVIASGTAAGGGYSLAGATWQVGGVATAPDYRLEGAAPFQGEGCCCTYLPCVLRSTD